MANIFGKAHLILILFLVVTNTAADMAADKIEPSLKSKLEKGEKANIMIAFAETGPVLESVTTGPDASRGDRATAVNQALEAHMGQCQGGVVKILNERNVEFKQFWINNQMSVKNADIETALAVAADPQVVKIKEEAVAYIMGNQ